MGGYPVGVLLRELFNYLSGKYASARTLSKFTRRLHHVLWVTMALALLGYVSTYFFSMALSSSSIGSSFNSLTWWDILRDRYGLITNLETIDQNNLFNFALYVVSVKVTTAMTIVSWLIIFQVKIPLASCLMELNTNWTESERDRIFLDVSLNPLMPIYSLARLVDGRHVRGEAPIRLSYIMNSLLGKGDFPVDVKGELVKTQDLCFMYHGDNGWDRLWHLFLKKFSLRHYHRHLMRANTLMGEDKNPKALRNINISIGASTFTSILGCNGSSKTTLLKAIINLFEKYSGRITWITNDLKRINSRSFFRNVSYIAQNTVIYGEISVYDFVACGLFPSFSLFRFSYPKDHPTILENLRKLNLLGYRDRMLGELSGGERQKAILARALTQQTRVIILDEPTTWLDINSQYLILNLLKRFQEEENKTIITILHDIRQAEQFSDEVILLDEGKVYASGKTGDVLTPENVSRVFGVNFY